MRIKDVQAFDDYAFMDVGERKPPRITTVAVSREAWDDMQSYIKSLEDKVEELEATIYVLANSQ